MIPVTQKFIYEVTTSIASPQEANVAGQDEANRVEVDPGRAFFEHAATLKGTSIAIRPLHGYKSAA